MFLSTGVIVHLHDEDFVKSIAGKLINGVLPSRRQNEQMKNQDGQETFLVFISPLLWCWGNRRWSGCRCDADAGGLVAETGAQNITLPSLRHGCAGRGQGGLIDRDKHMLISYSRLAFLWSLTYNGQPAGNLYGLSRVRKRT